jgi:hypothetical protein
MVMVSIDMVKVQITVVFGPYAAFLKEMFFLKKNVFFCAFVFCLFVFFRVSPKGGEPQWGEPQRG